MRLKPYLKWAGGKTQLIPEIKQNLPKNIKDFKTYVEPFVGAGAVFMWMLENQNFETYIINDLNSDLIDTFKVIKTDVKGLIEDLQEYQKKYIAQDTMEDKKTFYLDSRDIYNYSTTLTKVEKSALFIFLNKTCFNGLYRVNKKGIFNVGFGKRKTINLFDKNNLITLNRYLQKVDIYNQSYSDFPFPKEDGTFVYLDPPYKPISKTSNFNSYIGEFVDEHQEDLKKFCDKLTEEEVKFLLSNSDLKNTDVNNLYFDELYRDYSIQRVSANRNINSKGSRRGAIKELIVKNY